MADGDDRIDFPLTVKAFLASAATHLQRGDIILSRSPTFISWLIRRSTGSAFSHAALVFLVPHLEEGYESTFILESDPDGVGIANLRDYIGGRNPKAEIAVLRLKAEHLGLDFYKQVNGLMLNHVKSGYDYGKALRLALSALFGLNLGWSRVSRGSRLSMQDAVARTRKNVTRWVPPQFICSGFVQFGFLKAAARAGLDVKEVIFRQGLDPADGDAFLAVTPEDLATSDNLKWLFVARRGWVHRVDNYATARRIISGGR